MIKYISRKYDYEFLKRPMGAMNCDMFSKNGLVEGKPGFPSGHVTSTVSLFVGIYLLFPEYKNYAFKNNKNLTFSNEAFNWGLSTPSFSNGAAYGDLDNDGDLDFLISGSNAGIFSKIYESLISICRGSSCSCACLSKL